MKHLKTIFACLLMAVLSIGQVWATDVLDELTASDLAATSNTYADFSGVTKNTAVYAGNSAKDGSGNIQLRSNKSTAGIVSTTSGGKVKSIAIVVGSGSNTVDVYGSNTAYTSASELYATSTQGTKIGSLSATGSFNVDGDYEYVGIRSKSGALYLTSITITWDDGQGGSSVTAPTFTPDGGNFVGSQSVILTQADSKEIYYTTNGDDPTTDGTLYSASFTLTETTTVKAAAQDGSAWSDVVSKTFTKLEPLTTMDAIFSKATEVGSTATTVAVSFDNWVVSGVSTNSKTVFLTDGTKGLMIYDNGAAMGFVAGNILSGTAVCKVELKNGSSQLTALNSSTTGLSVSTGGTATLNVLDAEGIAALTGANTGSLIKISGTCSTANSKYYIADVQLYNTLFSYTNPSSGNNYECTGVFQLYNTTNEILPRSNDDIQLNAGSDPTVVVDPLVWDFGTVHASVAASKVFTVSGSNLTAGTLEISVPDGFSVDPSSIAVSAGALAATEVTVSKNTTTENDYAGNLEITGGGLASAKTVALTMTVDADPAPTGDWELFEGTLSELVDGDYLIYEGGSLMKAEIASQRFVNESATPDANGIISDPSRYAVWTLATSGDYKTLYNAEAGKYAAGTGVSAKGQLLTDGTDDKAKWSISSELVIVNKYNTDHSVNGTLRHNGVNGFACYAASTGNQPVFYKPAVPSYTITNTLTGCSAAEGNPTKVPQALTEDVELKYNLTTGYVWPDAITVTVGGVALDPNESDYLWDNTKAPAELTIAKEKVNGNIVVTITAIEKALDNITIDLAPNKVTYETGEFFNPAGLRIQLNYTAGASDVVEYSNLTAGDFTFSPDLETALAPENTVVEITYGGKSVNQAITVTDPVPEAKTVVIIAEFDSKLYAMSNVVDGNQCEAIEVTKNGDNLVVASAEEKAAVQWYMSKLGTTVNLQEADENGKYLSGNSSNASFAESDDKVDLTMTQAEGKYIISAGGTRAIMYRNTGVFKHYSTGSSASEYAKVSEIFEVADGATNIEVVAPEVHEFVVDPDEAVAFGTVEVDETVAPKSFNVTLTGIASATVTLSDDAAFSIDVTALTADGTITVTPNTANTGNFSATITLHDEANVAADKVINVTMKVVEPKDCDGEDDFNTVSTASSYSSRTSTAGWSAVNTAVITGEDITYWVISGGTDEVGVITSPELNGGIGKLSFDYKYTFSESNGVSFKVEIKQNGALVEGKSYTITNATAVQSTVYTETIDNINVDGKFQIVITNLSPSNKTGHKDRFAIGNLCWKNYSAPEPPTPTADYTRDVTVGNYGTICLPNGGTISGAKLFDLEYFDGANTLYLLEVNGNAMEAGKPYIFLPSVATIEVTYTDEENATAGSFHGLVGSYTEEHITQNDGNYILLNNQYYHVVTDARVGANRAYIHMANVPDAPSQNPNNARRRVAMTVNGTQTATGIEDLNASEKPMKMMINGQIFILRGEKMYDTTGRLVK